MVAVALAPRQHAGVLVVRAGHVLLEDGSFSESAGVAAAYEIKSCINY